MKRSEFLSILKTIVVTSSTSSPNRLLAKFVVSITRNPSPLLVLTITEGKLTNPAHHAVFLVHGLFWYENRKSTHKLGTTIIQLHATDWRVHLH
jgi:hypothetical protein